MPQETLKYTVKWFMQDKKLIKFNESPDDYTLSEKVAKFDHSKYGIKAGTKVDVSINGKEVTYLRKSEGDTQAEPPKEQTKVEAPKAAPAPSTKDSGEFFTWVVGGLPESRKVIAFKDAPEKWYLVPVELQKKLDELGVKARVTVKVSLTTMEEAGKAKPAIKTIEVVEKQKEPEPVDTPKTDNPKQDQPQGQSRGRSNSVNDSIERQCAWKTAGETISKACQGQVSLNDVDLLTVKIKALAEEGIKFIQNS